MNLSHYFWYFKSALTPRFCDEVIKYASEKKESMALTGRFGKGRNFNKEPLNKDEIRDLKYKRNSNVTWLDDRWIYKEIHPYLKAANKESGWNFQIKYSQACQFTKYKLNQYYDWHDFRDYDPPLRDESQHLKKAIEILPKGSIIVFPSFVWHRVKPVRQGVRYSLVSWHVGDPFK